MGEGQGIIAFAGATRCHFSVHSLYVMVVWSPRRHVCVLLFLCGVIKRCYCESFPESCEASSLEPKDGWRCIVGGHRLLHGVRHVNILNPEEKHDTHCDRRQAL